MLTLSKIQLLGICVCFLSFVSGRSSAESMPLNKNIVESATSEVDKKPKVIVLSDAVDENKKIENTAPVNSAKSDFNDLSSLQGSVPKENVIDTPKMASEIRDESGSESNKSSTNIKSTEATPNAAEVTASVTNLSLSSEEQKRAYASGISIGQYIIKNIDNQKKLHITLDAKLILDGIIDALNDKSKMNEYDIRETMQAFDDQVTILTNVKIKREYESGALYIENFGKNTGVKKLKNGMLYFIESKGEGEQVKEGDTVNIQYRESNINNSLIYDNKKSEGVIFNVASMPPALKEGVKLLKKNGEVKVVTTAQKAYGDNALPDGIYPQSVLVFEIKLIDITHG